LERFPVEDGFSVHKNPVEMNSDVVEGTLGPVSENPVGEGQMDGRMVEMYPTTMPSMSDIRSNIVLENIIKNWGGNNKFVGIDDSTNALVKRGHHTLAIAPDEDVEKAEQAILKNG